jgi:hypothetical protein
MRIRIEIGRWVLWCLLAALAVGLAIANAVVADQVTAGLHLGTTGLVAVALLLVAGETAAFCVVSRAARRSRR